MREGQGIGRRDFLLRARDFGALAVTGAIAGLWPVRMVRAAGRPADEGIRPRGQAIMLDEVNVTVFAEHLGSSFLIQQDSGCSLEATLVEASPVGACSGTSADRQPFSLVFRGPVEPVLPQKIYTVEHPALGSLQLFLVPIGPSGDGMDYEAVFN